MQLSDRQFDWIFIAILPPTGALVACALTYGLMRSAMGGGSLTPVQKTINLALFFAILGTGYVMRVTKLLGLSPRTLWLSLPVLLLVLAILGGQRYRSIQIRDPG